MPSWVPGGYVATGDVINVKTAAAFGAVGDGVADDTAALQAAIDACIGPGDPTVVGRTAVAALYLPIGTYKVTSPLVVRGVRGFHMVGASAYSTKIHGSAVMSSVLELDGVAYSHFADFQVSSGSRVDNAIYLHMGATTAIGCTRNTFDRVHVLGGTQCTTAFNLGADASRAVDENLFTGCVIGGTFNPSTGVVGTDVNSYGVRMGSGAAGNVLGNIFVRCNFNGQGNALEFAGSSGDAIGCGFQSNLVDIHATLINRQILITGCRSEGAARFFQSSSGSGNGGMAEVTIDNCEISGENMAADGYTIDHRFGGVIVIQATSVFNVKVGVTAQVHLTTQFTSRLACIVNGLMMPTAIASAFSLDSGSPLVVRLVVNHYAQVASDGSITEHYTPTFAGGSVYGTGAVDGTVYLPKAYFSGDAGLYEKLYMGNSGNGNWLDGDLSGSRGFRFYTGSTVAVHLRTDTGDLEVHKGNLPVLMAGKGLRVKEGSNAKQGIATLVGGTVTVSNTSVTASSRIFLTVQSLGTVTTPKSIAVTGRIAGTSFTITSEDSTDTSVIAYEMFEPA